jgi:hypothetical protein
MGLLDISVFNSLAVGPGATQNFATISTWVSFPEGGFQVLRPRVPAPRDDEDIVEAFAQGGMVSGLAKAANVISVMGETVDFATKMNKRYVGGKKVDRPAVCLNANPVANTGGMDLCMIEQVDPLRYMGSSANESILPTGQQFASPMDESVLSNYVERLSFYEEVAYTTATASGAVLWSIDMTPCPEILVAATGTDFQLTSCGYMSSVFEYWRADFVVSIQVVSTRGHGGQIIAFPLYGRGIPTTDLEEAASAYATVIDVSVPTTTEVVIPWHSTSQMLRVPHVNQPPSTTPYSMGLFQVSAVSTLQATETVAGSVYLNFSFGLRNVHFSFLSDGPTNFVYLDPYTVLVEKKKRKEKLRYNHRMCH